METQVTSTHEQLKALAKEQGCSVKDLIALAPKNDPFYVGTAGDHEKAQWFEDLWRRFSFGVGVHLRRVHYLLVSQDPPWLRPDGTVYGNTKRDWGYLLEASKVARYLGYVEPTNFVDRRNPDPHVSARYYGEVEPTYETDTAWSGIDIEPPDFPGLPGFMVNGYTEGPLQPFHLEIWAEKTTMNDVLLPLCQQYGANLVTGAGEMSITAVMALIQRAEEADRPVRIAYIADFDPAGHGMSVSVARKIEFWVGRLGLDLDIRLDAMVLTAEQVETYHLPRMPIKASESRAASFQDRMGEGAVELDALEALHPGELRRTIVAWFGQYYDDEIEGKARIQRQNLRDALAEAAEDAMGAGECSGSLDCEEFGCTCKRPDLQGRRDELEVEYEQLAEAFRSAVEEMADEMKELRTEAEHRLKQVEIDMTDDDFCLPEPRKADNDDYTLFWTGRTYGGQLRAYKEYRAGFEIGVL